MYAAMILLAVLIVALFGLWLRERGRRVESEGVARATDLEREAAVADRDAAVARERGSRSERARLQAIVEGQEADLSTVRGELDDARRRAELYEAGIVDLANIASDYVTSLTAKLREKGVRLRETSAKLDRVVEERDRARRRCEQWMRAAVGSHRKARAARAEGHAAGYSDGHRDGRVEGYGAGFSAVTDEVRDDLIAARRPVLNAYRWAPPHRYDTAAVDEVLRKLVEDAKQPDARPRFAIVGPADDGEAA